MMQTKVIAFLLCFPGLLEENKHANFLGMGGGLGGGGSSSYNVDFVMMQDTLSFVGVDCVVCFQNQSRKFDIRTSIR